MRCTATVFDDPQHELALPTGSAGQGGFRRWSGSEDSSVLAVADQREQVETRLLEGRLWCPSCSDGVLAPWGSRASASFAAQTAADACVSAGRAAGRARRRMSWSRPPRCSAVSTWSRSSARHSWPRRPAWVTVASLPRWACPPPPSEAGFAASAAGPLGRWPPSWRIGTTPTSVRAPLGEARALAPSGRSG